MKALGFLLLLLAMVLTIASIPGLVAKAGEGKWSWWIYFRGLALRGWLWSVVMLSNFLGPFPFPGGTARKVVLPVVEGLLFSCLVVALPATIVVFVSGIRERRKLTALTVAVILGILVFMSVEAASEYRGVGLPVQHWLEATPEPRVEL